MIAKKLLDRLKPFAKNALEKKLNYLANKRKENLREIEKLLNSI